MAVNQEALWSELMKLSDEQRRDFAERLMATVDDGEDDLDDEDRARLHEALARSREDHKAGRFHTAAEVIAELEARQRS